MAQDDPWSQVLPLHVLPLRRRKTILSLCKYIYLKAAGVVYPRRHWTAHISFAPKNIFAVLAALCARNFKHLQVWIHFLCVYCLWWVCYTTSCTRSVLLSMNTTLVAPLRPSRSLENHYQKLGKAHLTVDMYVPCEWDNWFLLRTFSCNC